MTALDTYQWMLRVAAVGIVIDVLEHLTDRRRFADDGLYAWTILRRRLDRAPWLRGAADALCAGARRPVIVLGARLIAVAAVAALPAGSIAFALALTVLLATQLYHFLRRAGHGIYGADQMNLIIIATAWLAIVADGSPAGLRLGLWFVVAQSCLSYYINGAAKLASRSWRSGRAIPAVFSTFTGGHAGLHRFFAPRPRWSLVVAWGTIAFECAFPLVLLVPDPLRLAILAAGVVFHASIAFTMGINLFVWAFVAPYVAMWTVTR